MTKEEITWLATEIVEHLDDACAMNLTQTSSEDPYKLVERILGQHMGSAVTEDDPWGDGPGLHEEEK